MISTPTLSRTLLLAALSALLVPGAAAKSLDPAWSSQERAISVTSGTAQFQFDSIRQPEADDLLRGVYSVPESELRLSYASFDRANQTALQWSLRLVSLIEYRDADGNGRLDVGDPIVRRVPLKDLAGASVLVQPHPLDGYTAIARYPFNSSRPDLLPVIDPTQRGELTVRMQVLSRPTTEGSLQLAPTRVPVSIDIQRYPFNASNTVLAIEARIGSNRDLLSTADGLQSSDGLFVTDTSWAPAASGSPRPGVTILDARQSGTDARTVYLSHGQSDRIHQDMQSGIARYEGSDIGATLGSLLHGDWRYYAAGFVASGALVGVVAWRRMKA